MQSARPAGPGGCGIAEQEAERKRIEAQDISQQLLTWKGIEATEKLASSPNAKVIVIGGGKDGLPLILGGN